LFMTFASGVGMPGGRGLSGGQPGGAALSRLVRGSDVREQFAAGTVPIGADAIAGASELLGAKSVTVVGSDDFIITVVGSGSGYGDPLTRDADAVARDVADRLVSAQQAREAYGVVLDADGRDDAAATAALRDELRRTRLAESAAVAAVGSGDTLADGVLVHPVTDGVEAVDVSGGRRFRCIVCHGDLGAYDTDFKQATVMRQRSLAAVSPSYRTCSPDYVAREFSCPSCGTNLVFDVQHKDEPISPEVTFG
jgi:N-methylhydantoinase B